MRRSRTFRTSRAGARRRRRRRPARREPYTVVAGDSLSKIAKKLYGDAGKWKQIFEANKDTIKNPI
jgi:nucleoid-associated protein YgaU